jgi:hypothetical protein
MPKPPFGERIKARLEELDVEGHLGEIVGQAGEAVTRGVARAGELAHQHRERIDGVLDRASGRLDVRTDGRFADTISRARTGLDRGVDRIEQYRPDDGPDAPPDGPPEQGPGDE